MHHPETHIPGTVPALAILVGSGGLLAALFIGALAGLAEGVSWLWRLL